MMIFGLRQVRLRLHEIPNMHNAVFRARIHLNVVVAGRKDVDVIMMRLANVYVGQMLYIMTGPFIGSGGPASQALVLRSTDHHALVTQRRERCHNIEMGWLERLSYLIVEQSVGAQANRDDTVIPASQE